MAGGVNCCSLATMSIRVTSEIRILLAELDHAVAEFDGYTTLLAGNTVSPTEAVKLGAEREYVRVRILGVACRIVNEMRSSRRGRNGS